MASLWGAMDWAGCSLWLSSLWSNYPVEFCGGALRKCKWRSRLWVNAPFRRTLASAWCKQQVGCWNSSGLVKLKWVGGTDSWMQIVGSSSGGSEIAEQCQHKHLPWVSSGERWEHYTYCKIVLGIINLLQMTNIKFFGWRILKLVAISSRFQ